MDFDQIANQILKSILNAVLFQIIGDLNND